jgi:NADH-quinone oxidoreductase subunit E/NADP-reducing hydrogenase subunit HndA
VQAEYGYVPQEAVSCISQALSLSPSKIFGVLTFYTQFHTQPQGRNLLRVCCGTACHVQGGEQILEGIKQSLQLNPNHTTSDGKFTLQEVACLGCCGLAPVLMLNEEVQGKLTREKAAEIIRYAK